jgi:hypothetical protein
MTKLINIKAAPVNWRQDSNYVYIGRPGFYGNPFEIGKEGDRDMVCDKFHKYFYEEEQKYLRLLVKDNLRGKILVCYCKEDGKEVRCHGNTYVEFCNGLDAIDEGVYI